MMRKKPFTDSPKSITLKGTAVPGADDRQRKIHGFDQQKFSRSRVLCIGAGGIISQIAPTLCRKGIGAITLLDDDIVEASNLNRQRFYPKDIGNNKAVALASNLRAECIIRTEIRGVGVRMEEAIACSIDISCDVVICGVDNNPTRVATSRYFRRNRIPVIFAAVSAQADHGYVFIQEQTGPCIACLFPDMVNDDRFPCPGTPAVADILHAVGSLAGYATDTLVMQRVRTWNYRRINLPDSTFDGGSLIFERSGCPNCRWKDDRT